MDLSKYVKSSFYTIFIWIIICLTSSGSITIYEKKSSSSFCSQSQRRQLASWKKMQKKKIRRYTSKDDTKTTMSLKGCISIHVWCIDYDNNNLTGTIGVTTIVKLTV